MIIEELIFPFRNLDNKVFPDLDNYRFQISLNNIDVTVEIIEQWSTGKLYVRINNIYVYPMRNNTNLLPPIYGKEYRLYYSYKKQAFIFEFIQH